ERVAPVGHADTQRVRARRGNGEGERPEGRLPGGVAEDRVEDHPRAEERAGRRVGQGAEPRERDEGKVVVAPLGGQEFVVEADDLAGTGREGLLDGRALEGAAEGPRGQAEEALEGR